jgi:S-DNA-T family DNA segregation ATPase FtsK/SpoIIIE
MASDSSKLSRLQGCFVSDSEIERLVRYWKQAAVVTRPKRQPSGTAVDGPAVQPELFVDPADIKPKKPGRDDLFEQAVDTIRTNRTASTSFLQRKLRIGYSRAARLMDELEDAGLVSPANGNQPRRVLIVDDGDGPGQAPMDTVAGDLASEEDGDEPGAPF